MCGVIGCYLEGPSQEQIDTLKTLFVESGIRGLHATGFSTLKDGEIITVKHPVGSPKFVEDHFGLVEAGDYTLLLIGHTRYSTSDLNYNQPIQVFDGLSICHNGVVDQRSPSHWLEYGYELATSNDSELIYQARYSGKEPLKEYPNATMAVVELSKDEGIRWYRNHGRPLHQVRVENGWLICSTSDIARRSGLLESRVCEPGVVYSPHGKLQLT